MTDFIEGFFGTFKSFGFISRHSLWKYCILPGLISLFCAYGIFVFIGGYTDGIDDWLLQIYPWEFGRDAVDKVGSFFGGLISAAASIFLFKYLVLIVSSPFMSLLSEKVEEIEFGEVDSTWSFGSLFTDLIRGLRINIRNLIRELFYVVLLMILGLFPVVGFISVALTFLVQAYFAGFGNIDYLLERHLNLKESTYFVKQRKAYAAGLGSAFILLSMTGVGLLFAAPLATVAATRKLAPEV